MISIPLEAIGVVLIGYLLGSIPFGVLVAKRFGVDIYSVGSGNPGATNVLREIGKPAGYTVFVFDFLKGFLATYWFMIPVFSIGSDPVLLGLWGLPAAVLGHTYPLFTGFRGGKGVATAMGGLLGVMPVCLVVGLVTWGGIFYSTRYVAVASIGFGLSLPICSLVLYWARDEHWGVVAMSFLVMAWIVWRHRSNLARLRAGTENRFERNKTGK
ncbi:MAG: glycerol-3-phosphate 1-O-acyltransferase PlsY [Opitutae bacterium]|jgi:acyl phosphate:glycerol-3-phosphate acyltransferase|nr:glycerol-3-phosphate 1-O-acyltransferase PlsY [Opitutae bacterium]